MFADRLFEQILKSIGYVILYTSIVNLEVKRQQVENHVGWVKDMVTLTRKVVLEEQPGFGIILSSYEENANIFTVLYPKIKDGLCITLDVFLIQYVK